MDISQGYALSLQQQRLWQLAGASGVHPFQALSVHISGCPDLPRLREATGAVAAGHEMFRTRFAAVPALRFPVQCPAEAPLYVFESPETLPPLEEYAAAAGRRFDPARGPALHVACAPAAGASACLYLALPALYADAHTLHRLVGELAEAYRALEAGRAVAAPDGLQYIDYSEWQREVLAEAAAPAGRRYWDARWEPSQPAAALPFEKPAAGFPAWPDFGRLPVPLDPGTAGRLGEYARCHGVRPATVVLVAWQRLLLRFNPSVVVARRVSMRENEALAGVAGAFETFVPVPAAHPSVALPDACRTLEGDVAGAEPYLPYFELPPDAATGGPRYFSYCFAEEPPATHAAGPVRFTATASCGSTDWYTLKLTCGAGEPGVTLTLGYDKRHFSVPTAENLARLLHASLAALTGEGVGEATGPGHGPAAEKELLLTRFNRPAGPPHGPLTVVDALREQAGRAPGNLATVFGPAAETYQTLHETSNRVARFLQKEWGVGPGDRVAVQLSRSEKLLPVLLGILKTGACYLPLDAYAPPKRVAFILADSGAKLLLTDRPGDPDGLDSTGPAVRVNDAMLERVQRESGEDCAVAVPPGACAYVIYTSGTTGNPKGVMVSHGALANYATWFCRAYHLSDRDGTLLCSSVAFDLSYTSLWPVFFAGGTLHLLEEGPYLDPQVLLEALKTGRITYLKLTPSHLKLLLSDPGFEAGARQSALRLVVLGGEAIVPADVARVLQCRPDLTFVNHYGPTEATVGALTQTIDAASLAAFAGNPVIGRPIDNAQAFILDETGRPVPPGEPGELCLAGRGLAIGYLNRPELEARKFVPHPWQAGERLYRTGDLARQWPDGTISFLGRTDNQVKIRGYRVETEEIEHCLKSCPGVHNAAAGLAAPGGAEPQLVAYFTGEATPAGVRQYLAGCLPEYMIPAHFVPLAAFALTPNGKIDRKALPPPGTPGGTPAPGYVPPRTDTEKALAALWEAVLDRKPIGADDSFFEVGGHSLLATRLIALVHQSLHVKVTLKQLFGQATIGRLAALIDGLKRETFTAIGPAPAADHYPVTPAQRQIWTMSRITGGDNAFNMPKAFVLRGRLDLPALGKAVRTLLARHQVLRTTFAEVDGEPRQVIHDPADLPPYYTVLDFRGGDDATGRVREWVQAEARRPFDLHCGPLFRAAFLRVEDEMGVFLFGTHHIVSDAWSKEILIKEITRLYEAFGRGEPDPLPAPALQYKDYAAWLDGQLTAGRLAANRAYWLGQFAGELPVLNFPTDFERPLRKTSRGEAVNFRLSPDRSAALKGLAQAKGVSLFMLLMAALKALLFRYTGQQDLVIGTPVLGRDHAQLQDQVGLYLNNLAVRTVFRGDQPFERLLAAVQENVVNAFDHQWYPFDRLLGDLKLKRDFSRSPLYDVVLVQGNTEFSGAVPGPAGLAGLSAGGVDTGFRASVVDLRLVFVEQQDAIHFVLEYNPDLFRHESMTGFADGLLALLAGIATNPAVKITGIPLSPGQPRPGPVPAAFENTFSFQF